MGTHPYLVQLSARGLRDTVFTLIIMVFAYLLFETGLKRARNWLAIFLIGVGSIYVRLHSLFQLIGLLIIFVAAKRNIKQGLIVTLMLFLIAWPLINNNWKLYHTWNYSEEMHWKWNTNVEFAGKPGFPSKESMTVNPFQGPPISSFTYFFKLHSISDLIISTLTGIRKTFEDLYFKDNFLVLILFIAGGWQMIKDKRLRYILILIFLLEVPHFFLVSKNLVEFRSMTQSLPFIGLVIGYIIDRLWQKLRS